MNIVVIIADQLRADHLGFSGSTGVNTPNIDGLAARGHTFTNAHVANPVCMPNRATIMTGRWPSAHGLRTNGLPLAWETETFSRVLRAAGWKTSAVGKLHLQPMGWPFEEYQQAEIEAVMPDAWAAAVSNYGDSFQSWEDYSRHQREVVTLPEDYYGFDDVALTVGHGDQMSGNYVEWAKERGLDISATAGPKNSGEVSTFWDQVYESSVPASVHPTSYVTEQAIQRIESYSSRGENFLLYVSFPDPHHPFAPPKEYFHRHDPAEVPLPESFLDAHRNSPEHIKKIIAQRGTPGEDPTMTWAPTENQFRAALAAELGSIEFIDDSVGRIVAALESEGILDSTIIVFTADHGDLFGDHGLMLKHFSHYRGVTNVPLIIVAPGGGSETHSELVSSADIAPTLLELVGAKPLVGAQGKSLVSLMRGSEHPLHDGLMVEEDQPFGLEGLPGPVRIRTLITQEFRLTQIFGNGDELRFVELYSLVDDPLELENLAVNPATQDFMSGARASMLNELIRLADQSKVPFSAA